jgi:bifunctional non-homologous end joining protein LigD
MLASLADAPIADPALVYEPKYDGIRAIAEIDARGASVRIWSRLGNDKSRQFPEIVHALEAWARRRRTPLVLDGEIVALDARGRPVGFQHLQGRIHVRAVAQAGRARPARPAGPASPAHLASVAFIAFDVLRDGEDDLRNRALTERRAVLERIFAKTGSPLLRLSEQVRGDGRRMRDRAHLEGWEGLIAKRADSRYRSGKRTPDWRKLKILHEQEFVIGGWTEPRESRSHFGALLLGVYEDLPARPARSTKTHPAGPARPLSYVAHVGTGFDERELARLKALLEPLEQPVSPFTHTPPTNERAHWVKPVLVAQVKFTEWTADGNLRHPVYLGLRDDKAAKAVRREPDSRAPRSAAALSQGGQPRTKTSARGPRSSAARTDGDDLAAARELNDRLRALEDARTDGVLDLPGGHHLKVTNLHKVFWPKARLTKGDLFRYYVQVAPFVLPAISDRPLVLKRLPNGVAGKPFFQHRVEDAPEGVRIETVRGSKGASAAGARPQIVGGQLITLLYTTQLAAISQDPWFSRVASIESADYVAFDLDPAPGVAFGRVLDVARWIHDELETLGVGGVPKTSGSRGLHVYVPLPPDTPYEAGLLFTQIVAAVVVQKHPKLATTERALEARGSRVYVDCLQNALGKTLASAYSARPTDDAGVSTPLTWEEVAAGVRREDFTMRTVPKRLQQVGDLWATLRTAKGVDLARIERYAKR